ncbi:MAG: hypothetical protein RLY93_16170, partial [Sumerlaeia bacterium]
SEPAAATAPAVEASEAEKVEAPADEDESEVEMTERAVEEEMAEMDKTAKKGGLAGEPKEEAEDDEKKH